MHARTPEPKNRFLQFSVYQTVLSIGTKMTNQLFNPFIWAIKMTQRINHRFVLVSEPWNFVFVIFSEFSAIFQVMTPRSLRKKNFFRIFFSESNSTSKNTCGVSSRFLFWPFFESVNTLLYNTLKFQENFFKNRKF